MWLSRSVDRSRALYRAEPRRMLFAGGCFVAALVLIIAGLTSVVGDDTRVENANSFEAVTGTGTGPRSPVSGTIPAGTPGAPAAPGTTAGTTPENTPSSSTPDAVPGANPSTPVAAPGSPTWVTTSGGGLRLSVAPSKPSATTGENVTFNAKVEDSSGGIKALTWDFGDGTTSNTDPLSCTAQQNQPTVDGGRTSFPTSATHTYRRAGNYTVTVTAQTGARCGSRAADDQVTATGSITITGNNLTNGTSSPTVDVNIRTGGMSSDPLLGLSVRTSDSDGYISNIIINWDDGSAPTVIAYPLASCREDGRGLPSSSRIETPERNYLNAGSYDITVTVTSVGCDGTQIQQSIGVLNDVNVGGVLSQGGGAPEAETASTVPAPND